MRILPVSFLKASVSHLWRGPVCFGLSSLRQCWLAVSALCSREWLHLVLKQTMLQHSISYTIWHMNRFSSACCKLFLKHFITPFAAHTEHFPFLQKTITRLIFSSTSRPLTRNKSSEKTVIQKNYRSDHLHALCNLHIFTNSCLFLCRLWGVCDLSHHINSILHFR